MRHSLPQADALACSVSTPTMRSQWAAEQLRQGTPWIFWGRRDTTAGARSEARGKKTAAIPVMKRHPGKSF